MGQIFIFDVHQISCKGVNLFTGHPVSTGSLKTIPTKDICNSYCTNTNIFFLTLKSLKVLVRNSQIFHGESKNMSILMFCKHLCSPWNPKKWYTYFGSPGTCWIHNSFYLVWDLGNCEISDKSKIIKNMSSLTCWKQINLSSQCLMEAAPTKCSKCGKRLKGGGGFSWKPKSPQFKM